MLEELSNDELVARLRAHVGRGNGWLVDLLAYLAEVDARRAYAEHACSSMWDFCVHHLRMSESEALRRIAAARVIRRFPVARDRVLRGELHLCAIYEMHKHLTPDNHEELLREAAGKSTRAVAEMIAARFPKPDVHACIEPLAPQLALAPPHASGTAGARTTADMPCEQVDAARPLGPTAAAAAAGEARVPPKVEPSSATRYRVALSVSAETKQMLDRVRDLMLHRNPTGDLERIFDAALALLLAKLEKERLGKTVGSPRKTRAAASADARADSEPRHARGDAHATSAGDAMTSTTPQGSGPMCDAPASIVEGEGNARDSHPSSAGPTDVSGHAPSIGHVAGEHSKREVASQAGARHAALTVTDPAHSRRRKDKRRRRRHIPMAIRREVFARDGAQCTFVDAEGHRCPARGYLELDHIDAHALGGPDTVANLRVRCRAHNAWHAAQVFGQAHVERQIHLRRGRCAAPHAPTFDAVASGLRSLGFRVLEVRRAMAQLEATLDPATPAETILREALRNPDLARGRVRPPWA